MRFDVPLVTALFAATSLAIAVPPAKRRQGSEFLEHEIGHQEHEIEQLEAEIQREIAELEAFDRQHHAHHAPHGYSAPSLVGYTSPATSAATVSTLVSSGFSASPSATTVTDSSSIAVSASESSVAVSASEILSSLSAVHLSLSSVISSVNATTTFVSFTTATVYPTAASASASPSASGTAASAGFSSSALGSAASSSASTRVVSANSTSAFPTFTASGTGIMAPTTTAVSNSTLTNATIGSCSSLCNNATYFTSDNTVTVNTCQAYKANETITVTGGQADVACGSTITPEVDLCRVTLEVTTSFASSAYIEVWMPDNNSSSWNGRTMNTDNGGLDGCVAYDQLQYMTGMGFAAIGDNGGHNSSAFDGTAFSNNHEAVLDWVYRSRHESVLAGKDLVKQFYGEQQKKAYYIGCSTGGQQGLHSAQYFPDDFDGIVAGSSAADMNHLEDWSSRFIQLTGVSGDATFLTEDEWIFVQSYIFAQCDAALDGVDDGIIEDPTACKFDTSAIPVCSDNSTDSCLTSTQINTVYQVFTALFDTEGDLLYPALLYGSQVDAYRLGQLSGSIQGIAHDWFAYAIYNNSNFDVTATNQTDYAYADSLDAYNGYPSSFDGDLSAFKNAGKKLLMYHGMADPLVSGANSQRYYLKVANTLGYSDNTEMDPFLRLFRISGMAHCGVGGISGAGAWMFGQTGAAALPGVKDNIIDNIVDWVENDNAPDTITGTKFWYDEPDLGLEFYRPHCRFPYRTTYTGEGEWEDPSNWNCTYIEDWQECAVGATPRLCNADGSFT